MFKFSTVHNIRVHNTYTIGIYILYGQFYCLTEKSSVMEYLAMVSCIIIIELIHKWS